MPSYFLICCKDNDLISLLNPHFINIVWNIIIHKLHISLNGKLAELKELTFRTNVAMAATVYFLDTTHDITALHGGPRPDPADELAAPRPRGLLL